MVFLYAFGIVSLIGIIVLRYAIVALINICLWIISLVAEKVLLLCGVDINKPVIR